MTFVELYYGGLIPNLLADSGADTVTQMLIYAAGVLFTIAAAYMLGSINFAIVISKRMFGVDVRTLGSGNGGSTNMLRNFGKKAAALTFLGDILKAVISIAVGRLLLGETGAYISGLFCILGHIFPCWFRFKGGKGVATAAAMILVIDPIVFAVVFIVFLIVLLISRYVSLSSIIAAFVYPSIVYFRYVSINSMPDPFVLISTVIVAFLIIIMHRENLKRLFRAREPKINLFGKKKQLTPEEFEEEAKKRYDDEDYVNYDDDKK